MSAAGENPATSAAVAAPEDGVAVPPSADAGVDALAGGMVQLNMAPSPRVPDVLYDVTGIPPRDQIGWENLAEVHLEAAIHKQYSIDTRQRLRFTPNVEGEEGVRRATLRLKASEGLDARLAASGGVLSLVLQHGQDYKWSECTIKTSATQLEDGAPAIHEAPRINHGGRSDGMSHAMAVVTTINLVIDNIPDRSANPEYANITPGIVASAVHKQAHVLTGYTRMETSTAHPGTLVAHIPISAGLGHATSQDARDHAVKIMEGRPLKLNGTGSEQGGWECVIYSDKQPEKPNTSPQRLVHSQRGPRQGGGRGRGSSGRHSGGRGMRRGQMPIGGPLAYGASIQQFIITNIPRAHGAWEQLKESHIASALHKQCGVNTSNRVQFLQQTHGGDARNECRRATVMIDTRDVPKMPQQVMLQHHHHSWTAFIRRPRMMPRTFDYTPSPHTGIMPPLGGASAVYANVHGGVHGGVPGLAGVPSLSGLPAGMGAQQAMAYGGTMAGGYLADGAGIATPGAYLADGSLTLTPPLPGGLPGYGYTAMPAAYDPESLHAAAALDHHPYAQSLDHHHHHYAAAANGEQYAAASSEQEYGANADAQQYGASGSSGDTPQ